MTAEDILQAVVSGLLVGATYWTLSRQDFFAKRSHGGRALVALPFFFVVVLTLHLAWPG